MNVPCDVRALGCGEVNLVVRCEFEWGCHLSVRRRIS